MGISSLDFRKILIINLSLIGDLLLSTNIIRNIREKYKDSKISFLTIPWSCEVLLNNPYIDEVIIYDKRGKDSNISGLLRISDEINRQSFDLSIILNRSFGSALICFLAKIPYRVSYSSEGRSFLLTHKIKYDKNIHIADNHAKLISLLGINKIDKRLDFFYTKSDVEYINTILKDYEIKNKPVIVINPSASWDTKRWGSSKFVSLSNRINKEFNVKIVFIGAKMDEKVVSEVISNLDFKPINLINKTNLSQLGALLNISNLLITNDTGPMHLASAVGTPLIAIFGPTSPLRCGPISKNSIVIQSEVECINCYRKKCNLLRCMDLISIDRVFELVKSKIK